MSTTYGTIELTTRKENANLCLLLANAFSSPQQFRSEFLESYRELVFDLPPPLASSGLVMADEWEKAWEDLDSVLLSYSRLFIGPFEIQAPPYASYYLEPDHRLMGDVSTWVAEAYAESALGPSDGPTDAPDHIALEWEFLYYLGYQAITFEDPIWSERAQSFINTHMKRWVWQLAETILASKTHPYYHALARFAPPFLQFIAPERSATD